MSSAGPPIPSRYASPAGWEVPAGVKPGWDWLPPGGVRERADLAPWWVRLWQATPFLDRYAFVWMWRHGMMEVWPPESAANGTEP